MVCVTRWPWLQEVAVHRVVNNFSFWNHDPSAHHAPILNILEFMKWKLQLMAAPIHLVGSKYKRNPAVRSITSPPQCTIYRSICSSVIMCLCKSNITVQYRSGRNSGVRQIVMISKWNVYAVGIQRVINIGVLHFRKLVLSILFVEEIFLCSFAPNSEGTTLYLLRVFCNWPVMRGQKW